MKSNLGYVKNEKSAKDIRSTRNWMFKYKVERNRNRTGLNVERYRYYIHSKMHSVTISGMRLIIKIRELRILYQYQIIWIKCYLFIISYYL